MRLEIANMGDAFGRWLCERLKLNAAALRGPALGLVGDEGVLAAVLYEDYNKVNILVHIAAVPGKRWLTKRFLWMMLHYPFVQLGCKRATAGVPEDNAESRRFVEHLGFELEARLKDATPNGDLLVYVLWRSNPKVQRILNYGARYEQAGRARAA